MYIICQIPEAPMDIERLLRLIIHLVGLQRAAEY